MGKPPSRVSTQPYSASVLSSVLLAGVTALLVTLGIPFRLPGLGLDPSWSQALVEATDHGRMFGRDIVFTYGPLHQMATWQVSENLLPVFIGRAVLGIGWAAMVLTVCRLLGLGRGVLLICLVGYVQFNSPDALFYVYCIAAILCFCRTAQEPAGAWLVASLAAIATTLLAIGLVKLSYLGGVVPAFFSVLLATVIGQQSRSGGYWRPFLFASVPFVGVCCIWVLTTGQRIASMSAYFGPRSLALIEAYADAMSISPNTWSAGLDVGIFLVGNAAMMVVVWELVFRHANVPGATRPKSLSGIPLLWLGCTLIVSWVVFKAAFVRHDVEHLAILSPFLMGFLACAIVFSRDDTTSFLQMRQRRGVVLALSLLAVMIVCTALSRYQSNSRYRNVASVPRVIAANIQLSLISGVRDEFRAQRKATFAKYAGLVEDFRIPSGETADIIPWDISTLLANGLTYAPRPIPQSYSVYSRQLQRMNSDFFQGTNANRPKYVVVTTRDIDGRLPASLDSPALKVIFDEYCFSHGGSRGSLVFIDRRYAACAASAMLKPLEQKSGGIHWHELDDNTWASGPILIRKDAINWLSIEIEDTVYRKITSTGFKPSPLYLEYLDAYGNVLASYRLAPQAITDMLIYPVPASPGKLYSMLDPTHTIFKDSAPVDLAVAVRLISGSYYRPFTDGSYVMDLTGKADTVSAISAFEARPSPPVKLAE